MSKAQSFKDKTVSRMTGKHMPHDTPRRDPRVHGIKNPAGAGEKGTQIENRIKSNTASSGSRNSGHIQQSGPGML